MSIKARQPKGGRRKQGADFDSDQFSVMSRPDLGSYGEPVGGGGGIQSFDQYDRDISNTDPKRQFELARAWSQTHWYAAPVLALRSGLVGFKPRIRLPDEVDESDREDVIENCRQFIAQAVREWLTTDAVIATWRKQAPGRVTFVPPERIDYSDAGGFETFTLHQKVPSHVLAALDDATRQRYESGKIVFGGSAWENWNAEHPDSAEGFRVLKRSPRGFGLGCPLIRSVFRTLGQSDSMESGESQYAFAGRRVIRSHRLGFEPKANMPASASAWQYTEKRAKAIYSKAKGRTGGWEQVVPWDYKYDVIWLDPKPFAVAKWQTISDRLRIWAGASGAVLASTSVNPDLMQLLRAECEQVRDEMAYFLRSVLRNAYGWKGFPKINFGNACFTSQRLFFELLRYAHSAGPVSGPTLLSTLFGGDALDQERDGKAYERTHREDFLPTYDAAHGTEPGANGAPHAGGRKPSGKPPLSSPGGRPSG